jgi:O-antigen ligase
VLSGALLLLSFSTISAFGSWSPLASMMVVVRLGWSTLVWFWIMRSVSRNRDALLTLVRAYQVSVLVSAIVAVLGDTGVGFTTTEYEDRQAAFTLHPNELMNFLVAGFFFFLIPIVIPRQGAWPQRATFWWGGALVMIVLGIFATGSTSALIAVGVAAVVVAVVAAVAGAGPTRRRRSPVATLLLVGATVAGAFALATSDLPMVERLSGYSDGSSGLDDSVETRKQANAEILQEFDRYLIVGTGPYFAGGAADSFAVSQYSGSGPVRTGVHNMQLKILQESGLIALIGLWIIILAVGRQAYRLVISTKGTSSYPLALAMLGSLVAVVTSAQTGPVAYARFFWLPFALIGCLWAVRRQELAHREPGNDPSTPQARVSGCG